MGKKRGHRGIVRTFQDNLKLLRRRLRMSQEEAAERAGVSRQQLSNIECGKSIPTLDTAEKIARGMDVALRDLIE